MAEDPSNEKKNGITNRLTTEISENVKWHVNITIIDLSARNLANIDDKMQLPDNLLELNLSHNKFVEVPTILLGLQKLKNLNLSHNKIEYFDDTPKFCHTIEQLNLSTNDLRGPPYWIWTEKPQNLSRVNLSCNTNLTKSFFSGYLEELLQYKTLVSEIDLYNCGFRNNNVELLSTLTNAKTMNFGNEHYNYHGANIVSEVPTKGLEKCCNLEQLNFSNTHIHTINSSIDGLKNLRELNLSNNNLNGLPNEFCRLTNLETCLLSSNRLLYLPEDFCKLNKLVKLHIDSNELCMLPENLIKLPNLKTLDLYDNHLNEILGDYSHLEEFDVALNYLDEPDDLEYLEKKTKLRLLIENRWDGRKPEAIQPEPEYSSTESDDEEYYRALYNGELPDEPIKPDKDQSERSSSPEDWDSDTHWVPHDIKFATPPKPWINFIHRKMREGNFCPIDAHVVSISEQVMYEKKINPKIEIESVGQFDDLSSDDS